MALVDNMVDLQANSAGLLVDVEEDGDVDSGDLEVG
jgi:hypothetical protein